MKISMRKVKALTKFKASTMLKNMNILIAPVMAIIMTIMMKAIMPDTEVSDGGIYFSTASYALMFGVLFNVVMGAIMMGSYPLAEEKEKHTLRVLMTSSVNSVEYFIGTIIPSLVILLGVNLILIPLAGLRFSQINLIIYLVYTLIVSLISLLVGFIIGMVSKNQMQAGLLGTPAMLLFTMLPMFRLFNETLEKIGSYVYSGVFSNFLNDSLSPKGYHVTIHDGVILVLWVVVLSGLFAYFYKRNGLEQE